MDEPATIAHFTPLVGRMARLQGTPIALVIDRVEAGEPGPAELRQPFTVVFRAPRSAPVAPEGLYVCEIEDGVRHQLYIMPIHTPDPGRQDYQAVFN